ncbi:MAG: hypothetical protein JNK82_22630 [Myxococcaceae bacterium]|nr:hypothetical protein [Myxococcaceae bacterium]
MHKLFAVAALSSLFACSSGTAVPDAGTTDEPDAGGLDAGPADAGPVDAGEPDAGPVDAGEPDAGPVDAGEPDAGPLTLPADAGWSQLPTVAFNGKQDDIHFVDAERGWYANGSGRLYRTTNGGAQWSPMLDQPGTYWRALGFIDERRGYLGNIGAGVFPGVTDTQPLYFTDNGGMTVTPVTLMGADLPGVCAIDVLHADGKVIVHAAGRVGGPARLATSVDGAPFVVTDLSASLAMITDVKFVSPLVGYVVGGTSSSVGSSNAVIVKTRDGGQTWSRVYTSSRGSELIWKLSLPDLAHGYATVQTYQSGRAEQLVAVSDDGGDTWREVALTMNASARQLGIGFISAQVGWVGTAAGGFQTTDGAATWQPVQFGGAVNKVRIVRAPGGFVAYAIGFDVFKLDARR